MRSTTRLLSAVLASALGSATLVAWTPTAHAAGQGAAPATTPAATPPTPAAAPPPAATSTAASDANDPVKLASPEARQEASSRFARGVQFYNDGDFKLALIEFQRAYEIVPSYKFLYNIGQVNLQLSAYAKSLQALERYLQEGADRVPAERRAEVEKDIASLKTRTARVTLTSNVEGAEFLLDDNLVPQDQLAVPVLVDAGDHRISARKNGYVSNSKAVTLAGGDVLSVNVDLTEVPTMGTTIVTEQGTSYTWAGWVGTGVLASAAVVTGLLASSSAAELKDLRASPRATREDLDSQERNVKQYALATDVLAGSAIIAGGVTLYLTLRHSSKEVKPADKPSGTTAKVGFTPTSLFLSGTF